ncbi:uncharacterized protein BJ212DRAFT_1489849 [Suillus subaureus]|uniref:Uncharacterized protein n=1 Tax=Suillus subaureus TaxID=48587 RepID=A0A9P7DJ52_9AGAM|nr:uncharacterized protein BJ212DRAFT_1489849 [Suillus subaureus]KAG1794999.1 hypothetical protein BJ212DRAFT_1489849 [Suillus subaureus]
MSDTSSSKPFKVLKPADFDGSKEAFVVWWTCLTTATALYPVLMLSRLMPSPLMLPLARSALSRSA